MTHIPDGAAVGTAPGPITADDLERTVRLAVAALGRAEAADWSAPAGDLDWDCWETTEHLIDDLFAYAVQLGPANPPQDTEVAFAYRPQRPGGPATSLLADRAAGTAGLLQALEASGALLTAMVRTTPSTVRAHHVFGAADPEGFAAMGIVETLVHTHDLAEGLGLDWTPPAELCARILARLFPDVPTDDAPWPTLLWATGRAGLPHHPRLTKWRWQGSPVGS